MNLESKELPKSFLVQVIWEWLTMAAADNAVSSSTHISHVIMCWNNAEWVVSAVSHLLLENLSKMTRSWRQHGLPRRCFLCKVHDSGAARIATVSSPLFLFTSLLSWVMCSAAQNPEEEQSCQELLHIVHMLNSEHWGWATLLLSGSASLQYK